MSDLKFLEHTEGLARNLTLLQKQSSMLSQDLDELHRYAQKQLDHLYRLEVRRDDITFGFKPELVVDVLLMSPGGH